MHNREEASIAINDNDDNPEFLLFSFHWPANVNVLET